MIWIHAAIQQDIHPTGCIQAAQDRPYIARSCGETSLHQNETAPSRVVQLQVPLAQNRQDALRLSFSVRLPNNSGVNAAQRTPRPHCSSTRRRAKSLVNWSGAYTSVSMPNRLPPLRDMVDPFHQETGRSRRALCVAAGSGSV